GYAARPWAVGCNTFGVQSSHAPAQISCNEPPERIVFVRSVGPIRKRRGHREQRARWFLCLPSVSSASSAFPMMPDATIGMAECMVRNAMVLANAETSEVLSDRRRVSQTVLRQ